MKHRFVVTIMQPTDLTEAGRKAARAEFPEPASPPEPEAQAPRRNPSLLAGVPPRRGLVLNAAEARGRAAARAFDSDELEPDEPGATDYAAMGRAAARGYED